MLKGIKLTGDEPRRRRGHHLFVTDRCNLSALKVEVTEALKEFLTQRFGTDDECLETLAPFLKFQKDANLEAVHKLLCPDLDRMAISQSRSNYKGKLCLKKLRLLLPCK